MFYGGILCMWKGYLEFTWEGKLLKIKINREKQGNLEQKKYVAEYSFLGIILHIIDKEEQK